MNDFTCAADLPAGSRVDIGERVLVKRPSAARLGLPWRSSSDSPGGWCGGEIRWSDDEVNETLAAGATVLRRGYGDAR